MNKRFFITSMPVIIGMCSLFVMCDCADAASRTAIRSTPISRKNISSSKTATTSAKPNEQEQIEETAEPEPVAITESVALENKSDQFETAISSVMESASNDNSFAEQIRKQRAALAASESTSAATSAQRAALSTNSSTCDTGLRKCMMEICGKDFTKCAMDGDTIFGDKLNKCRRDIECTGEEFSLFTTEIKADRDMNVRLASYNAVIDCGNSYNACIMNECGTTYGKCLGKANADAAIQKCATIAKNCTESDSGLTSRFGSAIGKLRENAESEVKADEQRLYTMRDNMRSACESMGAMFDERSFDCVYTVNFFAGNNQTSPMSSRKRYAGDTFVCMQEWFGVNVTTYKENAYRETRAQTAASSAMLGSGVGTAVGLVTSGAIGRSLDTQKAKKELNEERVSQGESTIEQENRQKKQEVRDAKKQERQENRDARKMDRAEKRATKTAEKDLEEAAKDNTAINKQMQEDFDREMKEFEPKGDEGLRTAKALSPEERQKIIDEGPPEIQEEEEEDDSSVLPATQEQIDKYQLEHPKALEGKVVGVTVQSVTDKKLDVPPI